MNKIYNLQDRGGKTEYERYLDSMDAVSVEKVASASAFFEPVAGNVLVDVGMASGTSSAILAQLFPALSVIGVDINPKMVEIAQEKYQHPNLSFRMDDGELLDTFKPDSVNGFFNCSSIHHITSYNGYDSNRAYSTIRRQVELLKENGVIVIRDFVKPEEKEVILELSSSDRHGRPNDADLLLEFSRTARSLAIVSEQGFPVREIKSNSFGKRYFRLFYTDAVEFIRRKDYYSNWEVELQEEYGYFTQKDFESCFDSLGLRIILSAPLYNPWIIRNRYRKQFELYDLKGNVIGFPPTNYLIAAEKVSRKGKKIHVVRHLPESENPFLQFSFYKHKQTSEVFDVVQRPNGVVDIIPYYRNGNKIEILAKHGYPRPLLTLETDSPVIDRKHYGGYITEGISASVSMDTAQIIRERTGIGEHEYVGVEKSLNYYTSPGGINEKVSSYYVRLNKSPEPLNEITCNTEELENNSVIRKYDAAQLLKTSQTGALVEARLEMNLYNLFRTELLDLPAWLGDKIEIAEQKIERVSSIDELSSKSKQCFDKVSAPVSYLKTGRTLFSSLGMPGSKTVLEHVSPANVSLNTLLTLPVYSMNGEVYVGLEIRDLPVPQLYSGNSTIPTVFARRLSKSITTFNELEQYLREMKIFDASVTRFFRLGEKYFPSIGVTAEQVYPYVVHLNRPTSGLNWYNLKDLMEQLEYLEDGHLLICLFRLQHAILK